MIDLLKVVEHLGCRPEAIIDAAGIDPVEDSQSVKSAEKGACIDPAFA